MQVKFKCDVCEKEFDGSSRGYYDDIDYCQDCWNKKNANSKFLEIIRYQEVLKIPIDEYNEKIKAYKEYCTSLNLSINHNLPKEIEYEF